MIADALRVTADIVTIIAGIWLIVYLIMHAQR